jgi:hypothetical protein
MLLLYLGVDKNIIQEDNDKFVQVILNTPFIRHIKVVGAFVKPNGTTTNS